MPGSQHLRSVGSLLTLLAMCSVTFPLLWVFSNQSPFITAPLHGWKDDVVPPFPLYLPLSFLSFSLTCLTLSFFLLPVPSCFILLLFSQHFHHSQPAAGSLWILPLAAHLFVFKRNVNDSDSGCRVWRWNLLYRDGAVMDCELVSVCISWCVCV